MTAIKIINADTAKEWLDKNEAIIIDVRESGEYAAMHIPGATLIPLGTINNDVLPPLAGKKLIIHCQLGRRSEMACEKLLSTNPSLDVYNLDGGIKAWVNAGQKVNQSGKTFISIDRQVQLTIGTGVLLGVTLGYFLHPAFLCLAAFFGAGLVFAGATGTCGLAMLLAKMPWNQKK